MPVRPWCFLFAWSALTASGTLAQSPFPAVSFADRIDQRLAQLWRAHDVTPAPQCSETTFRRRVGLDLVGRIPTAAEAQAFAADNHPDSRGRLIERLSTTAACCDQLATRLRKIWFPQTATPRYKHLAAEVEGWIASELRHDRPLNEIAADLIAPPAYLAAEAAESRQQATSNEAAPRTLFEANEHQPAQMATNATASFLGVQLSCAQCHDHPFDRWSQEQFWQTAAFFTDSPSSKASGGARPSSVSTLAIAIPETDRTVTAALFTGEAWETFVPPDRSSGRAVFATWISDPNNPYFARHTVNQLWKTFFGIPLVDTVSHDLAPDPIRQQLLDELATTFAADGFDVKRLVRGIFLSQGYQRASQLAPQDLSRPELFTHASVRGLSGAQLFANLTAASGQPFLRPDIDPPTRVAEYRRFCAQFRLVDPSQPKRSVIQALTLMNDRKTERLVSAEQNATIVALAEAPFLDEQAAVQTLFWATLGRPAEERELQRLQAAGLLEDVRETRADRYGQVFWLLINTIEFSTNH